MVAEKAILQVEKAGCSLIGIGKYITNLVRCDFYHIVKL